MERRNSKSLSLPGGRLNQGEDWKNALIREVKEETSLKIRSLHPFAINLIKDAYQIKYCVYFAIDVTDQSCLEISKEHISYKWLGLEDLRGIVIDGDPKINKVIIDYLTALEERFDKIIP